MADANARVIDLSIEHRKVVGGFYAFWNTELNVLPDEKVFLIYQTVWNTLQKVIK